MQQDRPGKNHDFGIDVYLPRKSSPNTWHLNPGHNRIKNDEEKYHCPCCGLWDMQLKLSHLRVECLCGESWYGCPSQCGTEGVPSALVALALSLLWVKWHATKAAIFEGGLPLENSRVTFPVCGMECKTPWWMASIMWVWRSPSNGWGRLYYNPQK